MVERKKIGDLLKEYDLITEDEIVEALESKPDSQKLGDALVNQGYITERQLIDVLEVHLGVKSVSLYNYPIDDELKGYVRKEFARENILIPINQEEGNLVVAMHDPLDFFAIEDLELATGLNVQPVIATRDDILQAINKMYDMDENFDLEEKATGEDAPAVKILDQILETGVTIKASDIHIDPGESQIRIRYRVDGTLRTERTLPKHLHNALVARTKILAELNITESRLPQDGRIRSEVADNPIDLRISTLPTVFGEKVVIRILDLSNVNRKLEDLGFEPDILEKFSRMIRQPDGLVLITGPTGSGKTSTLYGGINELSSPKVNIITVEDPVEYQIEGVNQVQVNSGIGLTFAAGLRSILRQDPNIIMVGEIRDRETAEIAIRSSLTGHMVFSTLHTNSAIESIPRLFDMGVEPYLVVSSLAGVMAQRLVKRICPDCKKERTLNEMEKNIFDKYGIQTETVCEGEGCSTCRRTGYRGRLPLHELIEIDERIKELMLNKASIQEVEHYVQNKGVHFLIEDGLVKVAKGLTTLEEVLTVAQ